MRERENPSRKVRVSDEIHYVQRGLVFDFVLGCCCDHRHWFGRWGGRENCGKRGKDMKLRNPFVCRLNKEMGIFGGWSERERETWREDMEKRSVQVAADVREDRHLKL